ncbi:MAG: hypothetical protein K2W96_22420 [Gemmataceae bacterium]|nr:hypothetical protein [Gemmataceae bacterium]
MNLLLLAALGAGLDDSWADLASDNEAKAARAVLAFAAKGKDAVAYLGKRLRAVQAGPKQVKGWLKALDADDFDDRQKAADELAYEGKRLKPDLEKFLEEGKPSPEQRKRVQGILDRLASEEPPKKWEMPPLVGGVSISSAGGKVKIRIGGKELDLTPRIIERPGPLPAWKRAARASAVLEHLGTPEAKALLKKLAEGDPEAMPTKAAKEALERLGK